MEVLAVVIIGFFLFLIVGGIMGFAANSRVAKLERQILSLRQDILRLQNDGELPLVKDGQTATKAKPDKPKTQNPVDPIPDKTVKSAKKTETVMAAAMAAPPINIGPPQTRSTDFNPRQKPATSDKKDSNFEFELGAKWTVWVGGLALLLGAVFLLRYSIEAGFFTPAMRIWMASVMGMVLLGSGEWLRRGDNRPKNKAGEKIGIFENSYIPGILTAVGIFTLLGTVFSAHELYGFIGATPAFILMGAISVLALALGLVHSPWISALGLAAAFATPVLIKSDDPSFSGLFLYLFVITLAAFALARLRDWGWLVITACLGAIFWLFYTMNYAHSGQNFYIWVAYLALVLATNFILSKDRKLLAVKPGQPFINHNGGSAFIISALLAVAFYGLSLQIDPVEYQNLLTGLGLTAALALFPLYKRFGMAHFWIAGLFAILYQSTHNHGSFALATCLAGTLIISAFLYCLRNPVIDEEKARLETFSIYATTVLPPVILVTCLEFATNVSDKVVGTSLMIMAALMVGLAYFFKRVTRPPVWIAAFLWGSALAFFLAILILFDRPIMNAVLASGIALYALAFKFLKFEAARWISFAFSLLTIGIALAFSLGDREAIRSTVIFNEIWIYLALPAALSFFAGLEFRRHKIDTPSEGLLAMAIAAAGLFFVYQIRHYIHDGLVHKNDVTFDEIGLYVATGLAFALGRKFVKIPSLNTSKAGAAALLPLMFSVLSWATVGAFLVLICLIFAPLFNEMTTIKGGTYLNSLTLAYLLPCLLMGLIIWKRDKDTPDPQTNVMRFASLIGIMIFITSQIRVFFSGEKISLFRYFPEGWETYTITACWLFIGVVALAIGIKYNRKAFRIGSGVIIFLTVLKAFLVDMATLEGVLRAISFVILGVVLIIIGRVYQKLLFNQKATADPA